MRSQVFIKLKNVDDQNLKNSSHEKTYLVDNWLWMMGIVGHIWRPSRVEIDGPVKKGTGLK